MTLVNAEGLTSENVAATPESLASFAVSASGANGATFDAMASKVDYSISGIALDNIKIGAFDWTKGANSAPETWTLSDATAIDLTLALTNVNDAKPGETKTLLTAATGYDFTKNFITALAAAEIIPMLRRAV